MANDAWGSSKRNFYGRDKKRDDQSSSDGDDEDEYQEALRLQKVRARKLMQTAQAPVAAESDEEVEDLQDSESSFEHGKTGGRKLGDLLFSSAAQQGDRVADIVELLSKVKGKAAKKDLVDKE